MVSRISVQLTYNLHVGGRWKPEEPEEQGEQTNSTQKDLPSDFNLEPSCCEPIELTTATPPIIINQNNNHHHH